MFALVTSEVSQSAKKKTVHLLVAYPEGQAAVLCVGKAHLQALVKLCTLEERLKLVESSRVPSLK